MSQLYLKVSFTPLLLPRDSVNTLTSVSGYPVKFNSSSGKKEIVLDVSIQEPAPKDLPRILELCKAHAKHENASVQFNAETQCRMEALIWGKTPAIQCRVIELGGELIGYATFMIQYSTWYAKPYLYVDCLYLSPAARGKSIGRRVMKTIFDYALANGCEHLEWQTPALNAAAIKFYRHLGAEADLKQRFVWKRAPCTDIE